MAGKINTQQRTLSTRGPRTHGLGKPPRITEDDIRVRAYELFQARMGNGQSGDSVSDWLQAEQELVRVAAESAEGQGLNGTRFMQISRPSGRQSFSLMVSPLLSAPAGALSKEAVVACFISDPEAGHVPTVQALGQIYGLTPAVAEVVQLLAKGLPLDEIAADRGISLNTVRSHLKHVFSKTGTSRQGELLGLVMTGVGSIRSR